MVNESGCVTGWIRGVAGGDEEAARRLWGHYYPTLVRMAKQMLGAAPRRVSDEEDVAASVLECICTGAAKGRFDDIANRDELWWLLVSITRQESVNLVRRELRIKRGGGRVYTATDLGDNDSKRPFRIDQLIEKQPTAEFLAMLDEQQQQLLKVLRNDTLRKVAVLRIEGHTHAEIAEKLGVSTRTVIRKLNLVRARWARELERLDSSSDEIPPVQQTAETASSMTGAARDD
ncbi:ECF sigma factor [Maioricimonas rarisocia]|uniref:ECF sigma factor n=1 Tax=Maioricimonas rarisocia TaxID=2528026 RepID=A0A517Z3K7_9PLAN|nr:ECF-type sigma factor [Maioricimonas rarisocia]QDU37063.1 ECF sigma factor [Maioricimonas rarisocia]